MVISTNASSLALSTRLKRVYSRDNKIPRSLILPLVFLHLPEGLDYSCTGDDQSQEGNVYS